MSHLAPNEFFDQVIAAGEIKAKMSWPLMMTRGFMGGALLAIAAVFAVSITTNQLSNRRSGPIPRWVLPDLPDGV